MAGSTPIPEAIRALRQLDKAGRRRYLQDVLGPKTTNAQLLDWRARLVTAVRDAELWPYAGVRGE